jgi:thiamine pyrophosphokinase
VPAAIVFAAASLAVTPRLRACLAALDSPYVVAADAGAATALAFGFTPHLLIGDFDSLDAPLLDRLRTQHVRVEGYPRDKDATDGQLGVERALEFEPDELYLLGFLGGPRLDHALGNILLLTRIAIPAVLLDELNECRLLRGPAARVWSPEPSETISLLPVSQQASGVATEGLRWRLGGETLRLGDTRGISNEPDASSVRVSVESGMLLLTRHFAE